jgi:hypothetical protein
MQSSAVYFGVVFAILGLLGGYVLGSCAASNNFIEVERVGTKRHLTVDSSVCLKEKNGKPSNVKPDGVVVVVETRRETRLILTLSNVLLRIPKSWVIQIFCSEENEEWLKNSFIVANNKERFIFSSLSKHLAFSAKKKHASLNRLFTSIQFWEEVVADKILIVQLDSAICSGSQASLKDFLKYDWIGAPWTFTKAKNESCGGGNGGFSLRSRPKMIEILR